MIGPKTFSWYENLKQKLSLETKRREKDVEEVDNRIDWLCEQLTLISRQYQDKIESYITSESLDNDLCVIGEEKKFSSRNPSLFFRQLVGYGVYDESIMNTSPSIPVTLDQAYRLDSMVDSYFSEVAKFEGIRDTCKKQQTRAYNALLDITRVEEVSENPKSQNIVLYLSCINKPELKRVYADLKTNNISGVQETGIPSAKKHSSSTRKMMEKNAEMMSVYIVHQPSVKINEEDLVQYVVKELRKQYFRQNPEAWNDISASKSRVTPTGIMLRLLNPELIDEQIERAVAQCRREQRDPSELN